MGSHQGKQGGYSLNPKAREFKIPGGPSAVNARTMKDQHHSSSHCASISEGWVSGNGKIQQSESNDTYVPEEADQITRQTSRFLDRYVPPANASKPHHNSDYKAIPFQVLSDNDRYAVSSFSSNHHSTIRRSDYEIGFRPEAISVPNHEQSTREYDLSGSQNLASLDFDRIVSIGEPIDWHCRLCGTFYTEDVRSCLVCSKLGQEIPFSLEAVNRKITESVALQHGLPQHSAPSPETPCRVPPQSLVKSLETFPSPTLTLERLLKHVDALLRLGHSGVDLKEVLVEGDIGLCMDLVDKINQGKEALNPWKSLSINIPDQPFLKQMPKPPLGSVAGDWTCSCGRENWAKRSVCSRCFPGIEPEYKAIVYNRVRPVFDLVTAQMRETHLRQDAERLSSEERRLRRRDLKPQ